jgi:DNA mismatch repair protein MutS
MVIQDARRYLAELERRDHSARPAVAQQELGLVPAADPTEAAVLAALDRLDPDGLSPREALSALFNLKQLLRGDR